MSSETLELLRRLRDGDVSSEEETSRRLRDLHRLHAETGAVAWFDDERARSDARRCAAPAQQGSRPLHGLPITIKDWIDVEGFPCAGESEVHLGRVPDADATVVARLRAAGVVIMAKTATFGSATHGEDVRHPLDPARMSGGSSAGEAVAVAAGVSPLGLGSDSGGSIRLPAAWCGVYGFKPTAGLVPTTGHFPRVGPMSDGRTQIGPLARDLDAIALVLPMIAGPDGADPGVPPVRVPWEAAPELHRARFAVLPGEGEWTASGPLLESLDRAAAALRKGGLQQRDWTMPWLDEAYDITRGYWRRSELTGEQAAQQLWDWDRFRRRYLQHATAVDFLLTPVTRETAPLHRPISGDDFIFTLPASLTGSPAISIPMGPDPHGLPTAVQLIGRPWEDHRLLAAARLIGMPT